MVAINTMVKKTAGLIDTKDVNEWENAFLKSIQEKTKNGDDTSGLSEKQIEVLEGLHNKHYFNT